MFDEVAKKMLLKSGGDHIKALKIALAYCSGNFKVNLPTKSLLSNNDHFITIEMTVLPGMQLFESTCKSIIEKYWNPRVLNSIRDFKELKNQNGVVFDLKKELVDGFIENFKLLKEREGDKVDFKT